MPSWPWGRTAVSLAAIGVVLVGVMQASPAHADNRNREPSRLAAAAIRGGLVATSSSPVIKASVLGGAAVVPDPVLRRAQDVAGQGARLAGSDRYATAVAVSRVVAPARSSEVVLASGADFPDALSAAPLASRLRGPLLLSGRDRLPASVATELRRLVPSRITVIGGAGALSDKVVADARAAAGGSRVAVRRLAGPNRYATSAQVAAQFPARTPGTVLVSGVTFPDGVAAGPVAASLRGPVLLTGPTSLPDPVRAQLPRLAPGKVVIAGGLGAVSAGVERTVASLTRTVPVRAAGANRYATSSALAALITGTTASSGVVVATGTAYPDALVGGVAAAAARGPVLLTGGQRGALSSLSADIARARLVGPWLQLSLDLLRRQQDLPAGAYTAHDAAYQAATLGTLYGWQEPEVQAQLTRMRSVRKPDGTYGMERAWDAFGDGSVNPASTGYLVTMTDHVGIGMLAGLRAGAVQADEVGSLVDLVLAWPRVTGDEDCLAYSNAPSDRRTCVYNVNSAAAWFLQSAWDAGVRRPGQQELAQRLYQHDLKVYFDGWWPYSALTPTRRQDWNHNAASIDFQFQLDVVAGQRSLDLVMPGGWVHPDPQARTASDVMGYLRLLPYACGYRGGVQEPVRQLSAAQRNASEAGQLALWSTRTTASCGQR
ncbi:cell wall-binding repeat-containing protein [Knoellia koreensis]|uniref:Cell wall-binding repeat-containing protein n=1 Tax=Knoellia koreensis TaxID=2730921 RepID=A0A849H9I8_9MICO|nr:cell wall-binding repeat-containing protein [Knoellia sp. DB2414S]NNM46406.1 cell wall-binding repeat-containing protein [Knoellia sp. DB2414S]